MLILGHRGHGATFGNGAAQEKERVRRGQAPENTIAAFRKALSMGADGFEGDLFRTKDGDVAFVYKDDLSLIVKQPLSPQKRRVHQCTMDELRRMDVGDGCGIPSLRDVFVACAADSRVPLMNLEAKGPGTAVIAAQQVRAFRNRTGYPADRIILSSFSHSQIQEARALDADMRLGIEFYPTIWGMTQPTRIYDRESGNSDRFKPFRPSYVRSVMPSIRPDSIHVEQGNFESALECARENDLGLVVWTWKEDNPRKFDHVSRIVHDHASDPRLIVITDYPGQRVRERQWALSL